jgi:hypothetical protein
MLFSWLFYSSTLKKEVSCSSEKSVDFQETTLCYTSKDRTVQILESHNGVHEQYYILICETTKTPWPESASELYQLRNRRLSSKLVPTFADRGKKLTFFNKMLNLHHRHKNCKFPLGGCCWSPFKKFVKLPFPVSHENPFIVFRIMYSTKNW